MITTTRLANGLTLIIEEMDHVESAAYDLLLPGGLVVDDKETIGASLILSELMGRGAGPLDSRSLSEAFDSIGARHGECVGMDKFALSGALVADQLKRALELVSYMIKEPVLPEAEIPNIQSVLLQDITALRDNPARRAMVELTSRYYPAPYNRSTLGDAEGIKNCDRSTMLHLHGSYFRPNKAILSIAGKVKAEEVLPWVEELFGDWSGESKAVPEFGKLQPNDYYHIDVDSAQMQIVMASPSVKFGEPGYFSGKVAVSLLGASMFGRLFVEVREKRGLCYSVFARHGANTSYGTVTAYVGTTPERAQESLDVLLAEFGRLKGTVTEEELNRAKTNLKATIVMGEESPGSRASSNATDWWLLQRVRTLHEISEEVDRVSTASVDEFINRYPFSPCSLLTLGKSKLDVPSKLIGKGA
jgi:predicted Zn-dependent peptidase